MEIEWKIEERLASGKWEVAGKSRRAQFPYQSAQANDSELDWSINS